MTQQERSIQTRSRILSAAVDTFTHHGFDATSVSDICRRAGVSKGAFYHHFRTKQAAFVALLEEWLDDLHESVQGAIQNEVGAPEQLHRLAGLIDRVAELGAGRIPMFLEFWRQASKEPEIWRATIEPFQRFRASVAHLISNGVAEGALRPVDPEVASLALVSMAVGLILQGALEPDEVRRSAASIPGSRSGAGADPSPANAGARAHRSRSRGESERLRAGEAAVELLLRGLAPEEDRDAQ